MEQEIMLFYGKFLTISTLNPFKDLKKIKKVFKYPKLKFYLRWKDRHPLELYPNPKPITIYSRGIFWKDKYNTPRYEDMPTIWIHLFGLDLIWCWRAPVPNNELDDYWEQVLWFIYYSDCNIKKAEQTWPWRTINSFEDEGISSWNNFYLI